MGHLIEMKYVKANLSYGLWNKTSIPKTLIRIVITALFQGLFCLPYFLVSSDVEEEQLHGLWAIKYFLPCYFSSFFLFAFGRLTFLKLGLINDNSIGGIFEAIEEEGSATDDEQEYDMAKGNNKGGSLEFVEIEMV